MNPLTEQELLRYVPLSARSGGFLWFAHDTCPMRCDLPRSVFARLKQAGHDGYSRRYPTREAAYADLRQAIIASGTAAGS